MSIFKNNDSVVHDKPMMLKEGDTTIKAYSVEECRKLAEIAKAIRKPSKKSLKVGPIEITGDTIATMFILCCLGVFSWYAYNWVLSIFKENGGERPPSTQGTDNEQTFSPKLESLNETILNQKRSKHKKKILAGGIVRRNGINVLVSNTGNGKSILSDQIGIEAASCIPTALVENANSPGSPIDTLLLDTELEDEDIVERYGQYDYLYPENFKRIANCWFDDENEFLDYIEDDVLSLEHEKFYIFDNLASLIPSLSGRKMRNFFKRLKKMKQIANRREICITFLIVVHTIKDCSQVLSLKDVAGSANITNFVDRVIALLPTQNDDRTKVVLTLKARDVIRGKAIIVKLTEKPYLRFIYRGAVDVKEAVSTETIEQMNEALCGNDTNYYDNLSTPPLPAEKTKGIRVPPKIVKEMAAWYQKGVKGHGLEDTAKKYMLKEKYGIRYSEQVRRLIEKYNRISE